MEDASGPWRDTVDGERQREADSRDPDVDVITAERRTNQKVVTDFATVSKGTSAGAKPRPTLSKVFNQGVSEKNPEEKGQLDGLKQALGAFAVPVDLKWRWKEESQGTTLEKNWTDIVHSHSTMSKMQRHQQEALWEFVYTELIYINKLVIIKDVVIAALFNLQQHGFLPELLWQEVIYPMLQEVRRTGKPFDPLVLEAGCLQFPERFFSYQHYCWEEENNLEFTRRQMESNPHFHTFVQWVETHPKCERMRLGDMQAKPHQRITKYPLLLKAVLKNTQDPHVQHTLRGMLSGVNTFLESINDYLKRKDEELALSISAQRVEGYEVEGINEDIDKHVQKFCQFDLTCPIRGVGPQAVRKLLLEDNLKIRGRRDNKLEVVALLFSDVLLMTKVQKKGECLKVVRPPLALDRTHCIALKDGCSFVLVEVGELRSAMNVYLFVASTSERCSSWVSNIEQAKETLRILRQNESKRQQQNWKIQLQEATPGTEVKADDSETEEQSVTKSKRESLVEELTQKLIIPRAVNGSLASKEADDDEASYDPLRSFLQPQPKDNKSKLVNKGVASWQKTVKEHEWIEMGVKREQVQIHTKDQDRISESTMTTGQRTTWNTAPNLDNFNHIAATQPSRFNPNGPHVISYPDVDYPMDKESTSQPPKQPGISKREPEVLRLPGEGDISTRRDSDSQSVNQDSRRSSSSQSADVETPKQAWGFFKDLKSPVLRRRRPIAITHTLSTPTPGQKNSEFFSDSSATLKRNSHPSSSASHRVLKLGSLKPNEDMFWSMSDRVSPDPQTLSESELPDHNVDKRVKTQRSASIPNIIIEGGHGLPSSLYSQIEDVPLRENPNGHQSPLEELLVRAKERDWLKRTKHVQKTNSRAKYLPPPSSVSTTTTPSPSPAPSDGDRESEMEEEEVELMRHRARAVSKGWKEQLVDGDEDDKTNSVVFPDGVNVDWSGWCFDDDEVMDHLHPEGEGSLEGISRSLALVDIHGCVVQEDGECCQV
ncbi:hypothetical protein JOQ06_025261 [Pogonophryne albipinna]|uniref:DH domain-containing protein n=1 Tax=Pogonophryne albipinna TaxID=1090488 RepID=A0AAD6AUI6_9TELE|nr:hypothetical protein JOQ06_025261 [Pogonophryne albipinna]